VKDSSDERYEFFADTAVTADVTVYAYWGWKYIVTFNKNATDATDPVPLFQEIIEPRTTVVRMTTEPTRSGYIFEGWFKNQECTGDEFTSETVVNADITVYAKWEQRDVAKKVVTFKRNDGTDDTWAEKQVAPGGSIGMTEWPSIPAHQQAEIYTFVKWTVNADGTGGEFTATTTVNDDITVYAQWEKTGHIVTFDKNAPAYAPDATDASPKTSFTTAAITTVTLPTTPPAYDPKWAAGVTFDGWNTRADGSGTDFTATTVVTADITVYAKWKFTAGTVTTVDGALVQNGVTVTQTTGSNQGTWSGSISAKDGSATYKGGSITYTFPTGFASYDFVELEYVYTNLNSTAPNNLIYKQGTTTTDYRNVAGTQYFDVGTNVTSVTGTLKFALTSTVTSLGLQNYFSNTADAVDITWKFTKATFLPAPKHTVTFNTNGGTAIAPLEVTEGKSPNLPVPVKAGSRFLRWEDEAGVTINNFSSITSNITLKAIWNDSPVSVSNIVVNFTNTPSAANDAKPVAMGAAVVALVTNGYTLTYGSGSSYQGSQVKFALTLPAGTYLGDFDRVTATINGTAGTSAVRYKYLGLIAAAPLPDSFATDPLLGSNLVSTQHYYNTNGAQSGTFTINAGYDMSGTIEFCIYTPADAGTATRTFSVTNVTFVAKAAP